MRIKEIGAEWVSIVSVYYQEYVGSSRIYTDPERTPTADVLRVIIDDAQKQGTLVEVIPEIRHKLGYTGKRERSRVLRIGCQIK